MDVTLSVNKKDVYKEVAQTTEYTGGKIEGNDVYENISTTDEDEGILERFWNESKNIVCNELKKVLESETESGDNYQLKLHLSNAFDNALTESMQRSLFSFFVMNIVSKWYTFTNKEEASGYAAEAATYMDDIKRKAFYKKKPVRPTYEQI